MPCKFFGIGNEYDALGGSVDPCETLCWPHNEGLSDPGRKSKRSFSAEDESPVLLSQFDLIGKSLRCLLIACSVMKTCRFHFGEDAVVWKIFGNPIYLYMCARLSNTGVEFKGQVHV